MSSQAAELSQPAGGDALSRRTVVLGCALGGVAGVAALVTPRRHERGIGDERLADIIPTMVDGRHVGPGARLVLPENAAPDSYYDQVLTRVYAAEGQVPVMMLIAYGAAQSGLMKVHAPEVCYASAGFVIDHRQLVGVRVGSREINARLFRARVDGRTEQVLSWTRVSDSFPRNLTEQRLEQIRRGLSGIIPDGVLVRLSILSDDLKMGRAILVGFAESLVQNADPRGRALMVGRAMPSGRAARDQARRL